MRFERLDWIPLQKKRVILGVFAHPDDETSGCGGTFTRYAREGVDVFNVTATRGELGTLGTGSLSIAREELPHVRERELRAVLERYGANPPIILDYRDQEVKEADAEELTGKVYAAMVEVAPDVVITFGPLGISRHDDHIALHRAAVAAFKRYRETAEKPARLFYVALPEEFMDDGELDLEGPEVDPTHRVDIAETRAVKLAALRSYASQEDAQQLAAMFEERAIAAEWFHQAIPRPDRSGGVVEGFW